MPLPLEKISTREIDALLQNRHNTMSRLPKKSRTREGRVPLLRGFNAKSHQLTMQSMRVGHALQLLGRGVRSLPRKLPMREVLALSLIAVAVRSLPRKLPMREGRGLPPHGCGTTSLHKQLPTRERRALPLIKMAVKPLVRKLPMHEGRVLSPSELDVRGRHPWKLFTCEQHARTLGVLGVIHFLPM